ncbi:MAG: sensor histidine kinase [Hyphomicrobiaceae bacterium]
MNTFSLLIDIERRLLIEADAHGCEVFGAGTADAYAGGAATLDLAFDAAMPAVRRLTDLVAAGASSFPWRGALTFWGAGATLPCDAVVSRRDDGLLVVVARPSRLAAEDCARETAGPLACLLADAGAARAVDLRRLAHELRTPLAAIVSLSDAVLGGYLGPIGDERQRDYLNAIRDTGRHMLCVVDETLAQVRRASDGVEFSSDAPVETLFVGHVVPAVDGVVRSMTALADQSGARIGVEVKAGREVPLVAVGPTQLRQMLLNLIGNAVVHGGPGVSVTVSIDVPDAQTVRIAVADDGGGIAPEILAALEAGEPPEAAVGAPEVKTRGTGIGLGVTRSLVEATGGTLHLSSNGSGTVARLTLPVADGDCTLPGA